MADQNHSKACAIQQRLRDLVLLRYPNLVDQLVPPAHELAHQFLDYVQAVAPILVEQITTKGMTQEQAVRLVADLVAVSMNVDGTAGTPAAIMGEKLLHDVLRDKELR